MHQARTREPRRFLVENSSSHNRHASERKSRRRSLHRLDANANQRRAPRQRRALRQKQDHRTCAAPRALDPDQENGYGGGASTASCISAGGVASTTSSARLARASRWGSRPRSCPTGAGSSHLAMFVSSSTLGPARRLALRIRTKRMGTAVERAQPRASRRRARGSREHRGGLLARAYAPRGADASPVLPHAAMRLAGDVTTTMSSARSAIAAQPPQSSISMMISSVLIVSSGRRLSRCRRSRRGASRPPPQPSPQWESPRRAFLHRRHPSSSPISAT